MICTVINASVQFNSSLNVFEQYIYIVFTKFINIKQSNGKENKFVFKIFRFENKDRLWHSKDDSE